MEDVEPCADRFCEALLCLDEVKEVIGVEDGLAALTRIDEDEPFDLILTDITMPKMDGETLISTLNERQFAGPIVVLSALGHDEPIIRCMRAGAVDYLIKPVNLNDLHLAISTALSQPPMRPDDFEVDYDANGWFEISGKSSYGILYRYRRYLNILNTLEIPESAANEVRLSLKSWAQRHRMGQCRG